MLAIFFGLGARGFGINDVYRYAQMAFEMRHDGHLVPTLEGVPYHEAMPLPAWSTYLFSGWSGSVDPWTGRVLPGLAAMGMVLATFLFVRRHGSRRMAFFAAAGVLLDPLLIQYARGSRIDTCYGLGVTLAVIGLVEGALGGNGFRRSRWRWHGLAGVGLALALAAKGPLALALALAGAAYAFWSARSLVRTCKQLAVVFVITAVLSAAWLVPYVLYLGPDGARAFFDQFVMRETVLKAVGEYGKVEPFWAYFIEFPLKLAPWSLFAILALVRLARRRRPASRMELVAACWFLLPLLMHSFAVGKHIRYLIPMVPAVAILAAAELDRLCVNPSARLLRAVHAMRTVSGFALLLGGWTLAVLLMYIREASIPSLGLSLAVAATGTAVLLSRRTHARTAFPALFLGATALVACWYGIVLASPTWARRLDRYATLSQEIGSVVPKSSGLYLELDPTRYVEGKPPIDRAVLGLYLDHWIEPVPNVDVVPKTAWVLTRTPPTNAVVERTFELEARLRDDREKIVEPWYLIGGAGAKPIKSGGVGVSTSLPPRPTAMPSLDRR